MYSFFRHIYCPYRGLVDLSFAVIVYVCVCVCLRACVHACVYVCVYVRVCVRTYARVCTFILFSLIEVN